MPAEQTAAGVTLNHSDVDFGNFRPITGTIGCTDEGEIWRRELQADLQPVDRLQGPRETSVGMPAASSARLCQLQPVPVRLQEGALH